MKTAIILGATGLTGGELLNRLLKDVRYKKIKLFSRSAIGLKNEKIEEHLIDLFELEKYAEDFQADEVHCCIGTTQAKTPDDETYHKIDYGIPVTAAKLAKENNIGRFLVISALGAHVNSKFFYNRTKGEMERDVLALGIPETYILQPSLIAGRREEKRPFEAAWKKVMSVGNHLLVGPLKKYRSIHAGVIADAMVYLANNKYSVIRIESDEIREIATSYR
ncbi:NAD(P)H-binding protein [Salinimicrobium sp. HB62]|uniref:NAD(P)H-binding protein n=1 Tax=Salinimicrobium sp. HB62 TaxID=3077781 RepID=UPI002D7875AF|nr:NAD(P)H-binding protein [Salinimicrobium sp. HB62]